MTLRWAYKPELCDGNPCPGDCDYCSGHYKDVGLIKPNVFNPKTAMDKIMEKTEEVDRLKDLNNQLRIKVRIMEGNNDNDTRQQNSK